MRGEHDDAAHDREDIAGIIPACAGSTDESKDFVFALLGIIPACAGSTLNVL